MKNQKLNLRETRSTGTESFIEERKSNGETLEILYQKMGDRWFTFYLMDDELVMTSVPNEKEEPINN